jgi:hypothetical protein
MSTRSGRFTWGVGYHYDQFKKIVDERANKGEDTPFTIYSGGALAANRRRPESRGTCSSMRA